MTMFVKILDLFNDLNKINLFVTTLKKKKNELFDREFNIFLNVDFLNWFEFCVNDVNRLNESTNSIKTKFKVERRSNKFFKENINVLKTSKWLQRLNSKIKQFNCMFNKTSWTFIQNLLKMKWWLFNFIINMSANALRWFWTIKKNDVNDESNRLAVETL